MTESPPQLAWSQLGFIAPPPSQPPAGSGESRRMRASAQEGDVVTLGPPRWNGVPAHVPEGPGLGQQGQVPPDFWNPFPGRSPSASRPNSRRAFPKNRRRGCCAGRQGSSFWQQPGCQGLPELALAVSMTTGVAPVPSASGKGAELGPTAPPLRSLRPRPTLDPRVRFLSTSSLHVPTFLMSSPKYPLHLPQALVPL